MDVVSVRLQSGARSHSCDPAGLVLEVGEDCIVETERGPEFGTVTSPILPNPYFEPKAAKLPRVLRRATPDDAQAFGAKRDLETRVRSFAADRVEAHRLPMRLGRVDAQLDGRRLTVYFTSEGRVDFRELVRDLSTQFHVRIDLRQIGDREDAAMRGGVGPCGRALCCSTFLRGYDPISIKMAKAQGLSLNPSKISGMCGRLMCCLKYEYDPLTKERKKQDGCNGCASKGPAPETDLPVVS